MHGNGGGGVASVGGVASAGGIICSGVGGSVSESVSSSVGGVDRCPPTWQPEFGADDLAASSSIEAATTTTATMTTTTTATAGLDASRDHHHRLGDCDDGKPQDDNADEAPAADVNACASSSSSNNSLR